MPSWAGLNSTCSGPGLSVACARLLEGGVNAATFGLNAASVKGGVDATRKSVSHSMESRFFARAAAASRAMAAALVRHEAEVHRHVVELGRAHELRATREPKGSRLCLGGARSSARATFSKSRAFERGGWAEHHGEVGGLVDRAVLLQLGGDLAQHRVLQVLAVAHGAQDRSRPGTPSPSPAAPGGSSSSPRSRGSAR